MSSTNIFGPPKAGVKGFTFSAHSIAGLHFWTPAQNPQFLLIQRYEELPVYLQPVYAKAPEETQGHSRRFTTKANVPNVESFFKADVYSEKCSGFPCFEHYR